MRNTFSCDPAASITRVGFTVKGHYQEELRSHHTSDSPSIEPSRSKRAVFTFAPRELAYNIVFVN